MAKFEVGQVVYHRMARGFSGLDANRLPIIDKTPLFKKAIVVEIPDDILFGKQTYYVLENLDGSQGARRTQERWIMTEAEGDLMVSLMEVDSHEAW